MEVVSIDVRAGGRHSTFLFRLNGWSFGEFSSLETLLQLREPVFSS